MASPFTDGTNEKSRVEGCLGEKKTQRNKMPAFFNSLNNWSSSEGAPGKKRQRGSRGGYMTPN